MPQQQYVTFIGAGNVAWHLAPALDNAGYAVREVYSRSQKNAKALIGRLYQAEVKTDLDFSESPSEIFIISVSDDAIASISQEIILPDNAIIAHTSGAQPLSALSYSAGENIGVFYPLQTFSKDKKVEFKTTPICIEAENKYTRNTLISMADNISKRVYKIDSADRKSLHIAAVFACNFTNHFFTIASDILKSKKLEFNLLQPLIAETINKALEMGPEKSQTGPAIRHDFETLDKHMEYLEGNEELSEMYRIISQHIIDTYP
ncbi:Rossmann-like and DUF2520 domain-containing protein [Fulvivirga sediminis]|uniref:DUF2520 domain-containing protein n=1 Tax=Fulvivirga sediminis TaxID=2803949 RepID=A0A937JZ20_9BACT|nr:Rossmann-like and DUF2520 domain-containing protein [Fulvivirga sediminis]MBL3654820.1 DUF2520 domain-containing protein [Fulvivirga sediminis]